MKSRNSDNNGCVSSIPSSCIPWSGPNYSCLGIRTNDSLTDVIWAIATRVDQISKELDVTELDLTCLIDKVSTKPEDRVFSEVFKAMQQNQCSLKELIDSIDGTGGTTETPAINLKCYKVYDEFGNEQVQDLGQMLQSLVNKGCAQDGRLTSVESKLNGLQTQIDNINITPVVTESLVTTCLTNGAKPVSQALALVAADVCAYKLKVGSPTDIQEAIGRQAEGANQELGTVEGWKLTAMNLAQAVNNLQIMNADLRARVTLIENNCCKVTCEDVKIGFEVFSNTDGDAVTLKFTTKAGTRIPIGFVDCGSVLTITDINGTSDEFPIEIVQGGSTDEIQITGFDLSGQLDFNISVKLCAEGMSCEKCVGRKWKPISSCPYCEVDVEGVNTNSVIIITYED